MANNKKMVEAITSRDEDFAKWYTDIVKKAELVDYSEGRTEFLHQRKGLYGYPPLRLCYLGKYSG